MKKRIISFVLAVAMIVTMLPTYAATASKKTADQMTEAEAWAAGLDVYIAWYNINNPSGGGIDALYKDSKFGELYNSVFPDNNTANKKIQAAFDHFESHFNLKEDTTNFQRDLMTYFLYECFFYSDDKNQEWINSANYTADQLDKINSILANSIVQKVVDSYLENEWVNLDLGPTGELTSKPAKVISEAKDIFGTSNLGGFGDFVDAIGPLVPVIQAARDAAKFNNVTLMNNEYMDIVATMYNNISSADKPFRDALALVYEMGQTGTNDAYEKLLEAEAAAGSLTAMAFNGAVTACYNAFLPLATTAATSAGGAVGAAALAPAVAEGVALTIGLTAIGVALGSTLETTLKLVDDWLLGSNAKRSADLDIYFIDCIRTQIEIVYNQYLQAFCDEPSVYNARKLNTISKLMFSTLLTENKRAIDCAQAYNSAGLLTELIQQNNYKEFLDNTKNRHKNLIRWRDEYTSEAISSYYSFESNHVKYITYNVNGGSFIGLEEVCINSTYNRQQKIDSLAVTIARAVPVRTGYKFLGWSTSSTSNTPDEEFLPGTLYNKDGNITLYAVWEKIPDTITYNANGGTNAPA